MPKGTGKMFVKVSGQIMYFCSNKCEKNLLKLERIPREHKWTSAPKIKKEAAKKNE